MVGYMLYVKDELSIFMLRGHSHIAASELFQTYSVMYPGDGCQVAVIFDMNATPFVVVKSIRSTAHTCKIARPLLLYFSMGSYVSSKQHRLAIMHRKFAHAKTLYFFQDFIFINIFYISQTSIYIAICTLFTQLLYSQRVFSKREIFMTCPNPNIQGEFSMNHQECLVPIVILVLQQLLFYNDVHCMLANIVEFYKIESTVRQCHIYKELWSVAVGSTLPCQHIKFTHTIAMLQQ